MPILTDSGVAGSADTAQATESDGTPLSDIAEAADSDAAEDEAKDYVETLTGTAPETIPVDKADISSRRIT